MNRVWLTLLLILAFSRGLPAQTVLRFDGKSAVENKLIRIQADHESARLVVTLKQLDFVISLPYSSDAEVKVDSNSSFIATSQSRGSTIKFSRLAVPDSLSADKYMREMMLDSASGEWKLIRTLGALQAVIFQDTTLHQVSDSSESEFFDEPVKQLVTCYQYSDIELFLIEAKTDLWNRSKEWYFLAGAFMGAPIER